MTKAKHKPLRFLNTWKLPVPPLPQCIIQISHNAHFVTEMCTHAHFCYKMVHSGICDWCIVGFVQQVSCEYFEEKPVYPPPTSLGGGIINSVWSWYQNLAWFLVLWIQVPSQVRYLISIISLNNTNLSDKNYVLHAQLANHMLIHWSQDKMTQIFSDAIF